MNALLADVSPTTPSTTGPRRVTLETYGRRFWPYIQDPPLI